MIKLPFVDEILNRLKSPPKHMQFIIGPRQIGKTTGVEHILKTYKGPHLYQLAEADLAPDINWLRLNWQKAQSLGENAVLIIDEIQKVNQWAEALKSLWDQSKKNKNLFHCIFLGSSSMKLTQGLSESLTGRYELTQVPHWDYLLSKKLRPQLSLEEYIRFGGYPGSYEFIDSEKRFKSYIKNSIVKNVIEKDILLNHTVKKPALFKQSAEILASYPSQVISYTKLLGQLQEKGNVDIIKYYIELFEGAFLFKSIQKYSSKSHLTRASSPKIIPLAPSLIYALSLHEPEKGFCFESIVGAKLNQIADSLYYWSEGSFEVDFIVELNKKIYAVEVKSGRKKFSKSLEQFLSKNKNAIPIIIDQEEYLRLCKEEESFFSKT